MTHSFIMGITFPVDIKRGKGEKSISAGQIRYAIKVIYMYGKKSLILDLPLKRLFKGGLSDLGTKILQKY